MQSKTQIATDLVVGSVPTARKIVLGDNHQARSKLSLQAVPTTNTSSIPDEHLATAPEIVSNEPLTKSPEISYLEQGAEAYSDDGACSTGTTKQSTPSSSSSAVSTKTSSSSTFSPRVSSTKVSSASTRQRKKAPAVSPYHTETEGTLNSGDQRTMASSSVSPPPARDNRKKKATTVMDEPWKKLTANLHQLVNSQSVESFATAASSMPHLQEQLFHHTVDLLSEYRDQEQVNKDKSLMKDAQ
ncbi:hypothetical protein BGZ73_008742 [Actinomortierella ambigua]|nr:hypothetical protein BGZ73_008742 [Actinomortierella ambigua]